MKKSLMLYDYGIEGWGGGVAKLKTFFRFSETHKKVIIIRNHYGELLTMMFWAKRKVLLCESPTKLLKYKGRDTHFKSLLSCQQKILYTLNSYDIKALPGWIEIHDTNFANPLCRICMRFSIIKIYECRFPLLIESACGRWKKSIL